MPDLWADDTTSADAFSDEAIEAARAAQTGRPRDEQGRFTATEPEEPALEDAPVAEAEVVDSEVADDTSVAETPSESEIEALTRRLAEKEAMIGRQSTEIGELRAQQEQFSEYAQQMEQRFRGPQVPQDWDTFIEDNPAAATQAAYQQGDEYNYYRALQAWEEVSPGAPQLWGQNMQIAQELAQIKQSTQGFAQDSTNRAKAAAVDSLRDQYPDLDKEEVVQSMGQLALGNPYLLRALESSDPLEVKGAVESLYLLSRGRQADTLSQRAQELARTQTEEELRVRQEASVASASRTNAEPPLSPQEELAQRWADQEERLAAGWNI